MSYLDPAATESLADGLAEYYGSRSDLFSGRGASANAVEFFRCHDTAHVVFGCNTDLSSEACVKMWSFFGTDAGLRRLHAGYALPESAEIYSTLTTAQMLHAAKATCSILPRVIARSRRMTRRWPWADFDPWLDAPLSTIRREYGIQPIEEI